ncbi:flagellar assembly protein FliH [Clostridium tetani]|uniref:Flagellar assembly protein FliH n=1 Tax=Clostridium tetani TaxID=1513 RepID=A0A4V1LEV2_CLOTA|nr:flagellar assembly protein FliH [Clostridium tetani]RXI49516.1 flagellar assembly protein FliH [Clostridium tetani]
MLSLYNVVKKTNVVKKDKKDIVTKYEPSVKKNNQKKEKKEIETVEVKTEQYDSIATVMFENYRKKGEDIINEAYKEAVLIGEEAYKKAYDKGLKEGREQGYEEAYEKGYVENIEKSKAEGDRIIFKAKDISKAMIHSSEEQCMEYIDKKTLELKNLIENIVESVFKREIKDQDALNEMVIEAVNNAKKSKSITIRCKDLYKDEIKKNVDLWKSQNVFNGDIFIISDNSLEEGIVSLEKDNGIVEIDINKSLEKIKDILRS